MQEGLGEMQDEIEVQNTCVFNEAAIVKPSFLRRQESTGLATQWRFWQTDKAKTQAAMFKTPSPSRGRLGWGWGSPANEVSC